MTGHRDINCDLLVIGAGFSGMLAAARASSLGLKTVLAGNSSPLLFVSGLLDYLGVYPLDFGVILDDPAQGLARLQKDLPGHPYSVTGHERIIQSFEFVKDFLGNAGLSYHLSHQKNLPVLTAMGTIKPSFMIPKTMKKGIQLFEEKKPLLLIDIKGLQGFSARQVAAGLENRLSEIITLTVDIPGIRKTIPPIALAGFFEDPEVQKSFVKQVFPFSDRVDIAGMPAVCGVNNSLVIQQKLEEMTGIDLFEIPGIPPSIPGLRLKNAFEKKLIASGVRLLSNTHIKAPVFNGKKFTLIGETDSRELSISAKGVILATGRFPGRGLHARRERIVETIFRLDVIQPVNRSLWHGVDFLTPKGHLINRAGIETDSWFRPLDERDRPVFQHLYAIGSILAHNDWMRLKSGSGVSQVSACTAVDAFYQSMVKGKP
jgi:glycerol-3-phosphate dehydrogenase subunit B